ncbi:MAG: tetratricopeptide repeat protein [Verrucomicrobiota bacterium]
MARKKKKKFSQSLAKSVKTVTPDSAAKETPEETEEPPPPVEERVHPLSKFHVGRIAAFIALLLVLFGTLAELPEGSLRGIDLLSVDGKLKVDLVIVSISLVFAVMGMIGKPVVLYLYSGFGGMASILLGIASIGKKAEENSLGWETLASGGFLASLAFAVVLAHGIVLVVDRYRRGPSAPSFPTSTSLSFFLLFVFTVVAHGFTLHNPFYLDDQAHILKNAQLLGQDYYGKGGYRFTTYAVWISLHQTFGFDPVAYHAANLIIHILVVFAFYLVARTFAKAPVLREKLEKSPHAASVPFWGAALFAVHPLGTEPINYASQLSMLLLSLFGMLAALCTLKWINSRNVLWMLGTIAFTWAAAFSKISGFAYTFAFVAIILVIMWPELPIMRGKTKNNLVFNIGLFIAFVFASWYYISNWGLLFHAKKIFTQEEHLYHVLTQGRVFWDYFWRLFIPTHLSSDHWMPVTISTWDLQAWFALGMIIVLILFALALAWKQRAYSLLILLALSPIMIRFLFRNMEPMVEYRLYPALPWFSLFVVWFIAVTLAPKIKKWGIPVAFALLCTVFATLSAKRSYIWNSPYSIVDNLLEQYPNHARCHSYIQAVDFMKAKRALAEVLNEKDPEKRKALHEEKKTYIEEQYKKVMARTLTARKAMQSIFAYNRENKHRNYIISRALNSFMFCEQYNGYALIELGRPQDAINRVTEVIETIRKAVKTDDSMSFAVLFRVRGQANARLRKYAEAAADYRRCLERFPSDIETPRLIAQLPQQFRAAAFPPKENDG